MKGVIMAGGFGTRLKPLTINRPKPMVPVANRPIMEHIVELLKRHGVTDLISILYFQPESITSHFGDGSDFGIRMQYTTADADYGTAGAVRNAQDLIGDEPARESRAADRGGGLRPRRTIARRGAGPWRARRCPSRDGPQPVRRRRSSHAVDSWTPASTGATTSRARVRLRRAGA